MTEKYLKKIKSLEEMMEISEGLKKQNLSLVATGGCFDILHPGHLSSLYQTKELGDKSLVLLNSDKSVQINKGPTRPIIPEVARAQMLAAFEFVDYVVIFDEKTPAEALDKIKPTHFCKGADYDPKLGGKSMEEKEVTDKNGIEIVYIPLVENNSTSMLINKIVERMKDL